MDSSPLALSNHADQAKERISAAVTTHIRTTSTSLYGLFSSTKPITNINEGMHTMTLFEPDTNWYMDTGATSHMTASDGTLSPYFNLAPLEISPLVMDREFQIAVKNINP
ncbi:hypothetical protein OSB04_un001788 [Centaurea solstitialis]|uniref:Uncharacterized protein n=1 Tax=Centaurea solstitialis TaxID=347529 RepID=A0AA38SFB7_9ASTR|nr:hypothetical protein OSB04_un001788 [Centaurea solstitialis]